MYILAVAGGDLKSSITLVKLLPLSGITGAKLPAGHVNMQHRDA